jgi:hypothetical protein
MWIAATVRQSAVSKEKTNAEFQLYKEAKKIYRCASGTQYPFLPVEFFN